MQLTTPQADVLSQVARCYLLDLPFTRLQTGGAGFVSIKTLRSLLEKDVLAIHPDKRSPYTYVYYVVPAGPALALLTELAEWQYGELFSYFDEAGVRYNPDAALSELRHMAFLHKFQKGSKR